MTANERIYLKSVVISVFIEVIVLVFTLDPMSAGFMVHSSAGADQIPLVQQYLALFGIIFHLPGIILTFWFLPLLPVAQVLFLSGVVYLIFRLFGKYSGRSEVENSSETYKTYPQKKEKTKLTSYSKKDEISSRYWL